MKTFILKEPVYNNVTFSAGTVIRLIKDEFCNFIALDGEHQGVKGYVAGGLNGLLLENTNENIVLINKLMSDKMKLNASLMRLNTEWNAIPTVIVTDDMYQPLN